MTTQDIAKISEKEIGPRLPLKRGTEDLLPVSGELDTMTIARAFVKCGWFSDTRDVAQAVVKILAGREIGIGPMASMTGVNIIQGRPAWSANVMAAKVKGSSRYDYRVRQADETVCDLEFYESGQSVGHSKYTLAEATHAGLTQKDSWKRYPADMLFARAMSRGCRRFCPDAFGGLTAYTPEELRSAIVEETSTAPRGISAEPVAEDADVTEADHLPFGESEHPAESAEQSGFDEVESRRLDALQQILDYVGTKGPDGWAKLQRWWGSHYDSTPETADTATLLAAYAKLTAGKAATQVLSERGRP